MIGRAVIIWCVVLACAMVNGAFRETVLSPRLGTGTAHVVSTLLLSAVVLLVAAATIGWMGPATTGDALIIGLVWLVLVLAFEFLAGHYLFGDSWEKLLADYNVLQGRIWPLALVVTFFAPLIGYVARR